ncbi:hypothetical protein C1646_662776 [Rhizophagus diaphanus]|nr:hypothetical protein C1646_662776 [Rhizophagus diaphanus] [Rhizophagus sp. MUCL 43196]
MTQLSTFRKDSSSNIGSASNQLLKHNERSRNENFGQIVLNPKALNVLRTIHEPLAIISVAAKGIKKFFYEFDVFGGCNKTILQHMEGAIIDELDEEFVDENYAEFQKALKSFELTYEKSMMKSPKAARRREQLHDEMLKQQRFDEEGNNMSNLSKYKEKLKKN